MGFAFILTLAFCVLEFFGSAVSGSLALATDAGHMLSDTGGLGLALFASWVAQKPPTRKLSFGYYRFEILAALINGAILISLAVFFVIEAWSRFRVPHEVQTPVMLAVAFVGLLINLLCAFLLKPHSHESINFKGAFYHVMADVLSSLAVISSGLVIQFTNWYPADALISILIAGLIVYSAVRLLGDAVEVLLEATPGRVDTQLLEKRILQISGIRALHELHIWSISSHKASLSAHLEVESWVDADATLRAVNALLNSEFDIGHSTIQVEKDTQNCPPEDRCPG